MPEYTDHPLTFEIGEYSGTDWPVAFVDFGDVEREGEMVRVRGVITTDSVHASDLRYGDQVADLRLWTAARELLLACQKALEWYDATGAWPLGEPEWVATAKAALAKVRGEVKPDMTRDEWLEQIDGDWRAGRL